MAGPTGSASTWRAAIYTDRIQTHGSYTLTSSPGGELCSSHTLGSRQRVCEGARDCLESGVAVVMGGEPWREDFTHAGRTICGVTQEVPGAVWSSQGEGRLRHVVNMRGKTDWSSPPFSTLSTLVLPTL